MSFSYQLKSHDDIGYRKFFDTFRDEYAEQCWSFDDNEYARIDFINDKLSKYNARIHIGGSGLITFDSEQHFTFFVLTWT